MNGLEVFVCILSLELSKRGEFAVCDKPRCLTLQQAAIARAAGHAFVWDPKAWMKISSRLGESIVKAKANAGTPFVSLIMVLSCYELYFGCATSNVSQNVQAARVKGRQTMSAANGTPQVD